MDAVWKQPDGNGGYYEVYHKTTAENVKYSDTTVASILNNLPLNTMSSYMKSLAATADAAAARKILGIPRAIIHDECSANWLTSGIPTIGTLGKCNFNGNYARRSASVILGGNVPFTIEFSATTEATGATQYIVCFFNSDNDRFQFNGVNDLPTFVLKNNGNTILNDEQGSETMYKTFRHMALSYDGANVRAFVDGVLLTTVSQVLTSMAYTVYLGCRRLSTGITCSNVKIDEFRISNICRYSADFTPSERHELDENTVSLLHFD